MKDNGSRQSKVEGNCDGGRRQKPRKFQKKMKNILYNIISYQIDDTVLKK